MLFIHRWIMLVRIYFKNKILYYQHKKFRKSWKKNRGVFSPINYDEKKFDLYCIPGVDEVNWRR
jgi:hypothetical protein